MYFNTYINFTSQ